MDSIKTWLVEVALRKIGPVALGSIMASGLALAAAHQGLLESWGITVGNWPLVWPNGQQPSGHVILVELDTVSSMGLVAISGVVMTLMAALQHHTGAAVAGKPQSGDKRTTDAPMVGGDRPGDPPNVV